MPNVIGLFHKTSEAQNAVQRLVDSGIDRHQISVVSRDTTEELRNVKTDDDTSGTAKGAGIGAALGGVGGLLAGLAGLAIPGIGPILAAGPIAAALGGALGGAGLGAVAGGLIGALTDMGVPENEARHYEGAVRRGRTLVAVRSDDDVTAERAADILQSCGAVEIDGDDIQERTKRSDVFGGEPETPVAAMSERETLSNEVDEPDYRRVTRTDSDRDAEARRDLRANADIGADEFRNPESATIPVKEEELVVGKRKVEGSRVRIYGRVVEKPVEQSVQLHNERIVVERRPVDRPVSNDDRTAETEIEIRETHEVPVVGKRERVVEEVVVGKTAEDRTETVRDKVRRTEVEVERSGEEELREERRR